MINTDEDALRCDLAETYQIYNMKGLPLLDVATFSCGLRDDSRAKLAISDSKYPFETLLMAMMVDRLNFLAWTKTESASNNENRPKSIFNILMGLDESDMETFSSGKEFEQMKARLLENST